MRQLYLHLIYLPLKILRYLQHNIALCSAIRLARVEAKPKVLRCFATILACGAPSIEEMIGRWKQSGDPHSSSAWRRSSAEFDERIFLRRFYQVRKELIEQGEVSWHVSIAA